MFSQQKLPAFSLFLVVLFETRWPAAHIQKKKVLHHTTCGFNLLMAFSIWVSHLWVLPPVLPQTPLHLKQSVQQLLFRKRLRTSWLLLSFTLDIRRRVIRRSCRWLVLSQRRQRLTGCASNQVFFRWGAEEVLGPTCSTTNQRLHGGNFQLKFLSERLGLLFLMTA